jgi:hypothetical protein
MSSGNRPRRQKTVRFGRLPFWEQSIWMMVANLRLAVQSSRALEVSQIEYDVNRERVCDRQHQPGRRRRARNVDRTCRDSSPIWRQRKCVNWFKLREHVSCRFARLQGPSRQIEFRGGLRPSHKKNHQVKPVEGALPQTWLCVRLGNRAGTVNVSSWCPLMSQTNTSQSVRTHHLRAVPTEQNKAILSG